MALRPTDLPDWATNEVATDNIEPATAIKTGGVPNGSTLGREHVNWQFNLIGKWVAFMNAAILDKDNNLSDLTDAGAARTNLGLNTTSTTISANTNGNAATATKLQTSRNIGGVSFDGSANINLPGVNIAGNQNTSGNAATATNAAVTSLWSGSSSTVGITLDIGKYIVLAYIGGVTYTSQIWVTATSGQFGGSVAADNRILYNRSTSSMTMSGGVINNIFLIGNSGSILG